MCEITNKTPANKNRFINRLCQVLKYKLPQTKTFVCVSCAELGSFFEGFVAFY